MWHTMMLPSFLDLLEALIAAVSLIHFSCAVLCGLLAAHYPTPYPTTVTSTIHTKKHTPSVSYIIYI